VAGGVRVITGVDDGANGGTADDGVLQTSEVRKEKVVCAGVAGKDGEKGAEGKDGQGCAAVEASWLAALTVASALRRRRSRA
jgi:hypothetical protein